MSTPRRRSSRLRGSNSTSTPNKNVCYQARAGLLQLCTHHLLQNDGYAICRLSSLAEDDETPINGIESNLDAIVTSPLVPQTPATAGRMKPAWSEMHPNHARQSTTKLHNEGLALGFTDAPEIKNNGLSEQTPSKTSAIASPSFDFRFARPAPNLGPEAQRLMDELREEALRIKARLAAEREEDKIRAEQEGEVSSRKIAKPKGKAGRFSDVHMEEFKKMDSIAGHASSFRAQPGRFTSTNTGLKRSQSKVKLNDDVDEQAPAPLGRSLKRSHSKAKLDALELKEPSGSSYRSLKRTQSKANLADEELETKDPVARKTNKSTDRSNTVKRARVEDQVPPSASQDKTTEPSTPNKPMTPAIPRSRSMLEALTTPTQASLSRAATVKHTSSIPTLNRSPSKASLVAPRKLNKSSGVGNLSSMARSFLHRKNKSPVNTAEKSSIPIAHTPSKVNANLNKELPSTPTTPLNQKTKSVLQQTTLTPSPLKSCIPRSKSTRTLNGEVAYPKLEQCSGSIIAGIVDYPSLEVKPLPLPCELDQCPPPVSIPGTFTFRADQTIRFGQSPRGFGSSPGKASIRQVRSSIVSQLMPGAFPTENKENMQNISSMPHGIEGKKRARADEGMEDIPHYAHGITNKKRHRAEDSDGDMQGNEEERASKKHKVQHSSSQDSPLRIPRLQQKLMAEKTASQSRIPSPAKKKGVLSMSRLNMLARPKNRK